MKKRILIAPLSWGLGHATRCIPIVNQLLQQNFEPIIASDGEALELLKKEFPKLQTLLLPSYNVHYATSNKSFKWSLLRQFPKFLKSIKKEHYFLKHWLQNNTIHGIISDNRYGMYSKTIPSVIITHQLRVFSGKTTAISTFFQQQLIKNFKACWVPDTAHTPTLSGNLSHNVKETLPIRYIGCLSRFQKKETVLRHDILVLISGPEPKRTIFEKQMLQLFKNTDKNIVIVCGNISETQKTTKQRNCTVYNFALTTQLEQLINESKLVVARSGYSTIMDLSSLGKKAFFIPTEGQFEQEYLALFLEKERIAPFSSEEKFTLKDIEKIAHYKGFSYKKPALPTDLFSLF